VTAARFRAITSCYSSLRLGVVGDFCLDRYLEIDPAKKEISIETGLPVHNVTNVRAQPGGAGTILNNLAALGVGTIYPIGFAGHDGEGFELMQALERRPGVHLSHFVHTAERRTFTYCKPLVLAGGDPPLSAAFQALVDDYVATKFHKRETPLPATSAPTVVAPAASGGAKPALRVIA